MKILKGDIVYKKWLFWNIKNCKSIDFGMLSIIINGIWFIKTEGIVSSQSEHKVPKQFHKKYIRCNRKYRKCIKTLTNEYFKNETG